MYYLDGIEPVDSDKTKRVINEIIEVLSKNKISYRYAKFCLSEAKRELEERI